MRRVQREPHRPPTLAACCSRCLHAKQAQRMLPTTWMMQLEVAASALRRSGRSGSTGGATAPAQVIPGALQSLQGSHASLTRAPACSPALREGSSGVSRRRAAPARTCPEALPQRQRPDR